MLVSVLNVILCNFFETFMEFGFEYKVRCFSFSSLLDEVCVCISFQDDIIMPD